MHQHHVDDLQGGAALLGVHQRSEDEEEDQREQIIEEQHRAIAQRQPQVHPDLCEVGVHLDPSA